MANFYASPTGSSGNPGTIGSPRDLASAIAAATTPASPGDTIWLRGGTYSGLFTSTLAGTAANPIRVRQYEGERAILEGTNATSYVLHIGGQYTWFYEFEVRNPSTLRTSAQSGSFPTDIVLDEGVTTIQTAGSGVNCRVIHLVVHDTRQGITPWKEAEGFESYGCLSYYNGWNAPDRGHGHGAYSQNATGTKKFANNIFFSNFSHGIQIYGTVAATLDNFLIEDNTFTNNGDLIGGGDAERNLLLGGGNISDGSTIRNNTLIYKAPLDGQVANFGYSPSGAGMSNSAVTGNGIYGGRLFINDELNTPGFTCTSNLIWATLADFAQATYPTNTYYGAQPTGLQVIVRSSEYITRRAHITVLNWDLASTVAVSLASAGYVSGDTYRVVDAMNFFGSPVVEGTYNGTSITIPMTGLTMVAPINTSTTATHPAPLYGVFVVTGSASVPAVSWFDGLTTSGRLTGVGQG